jgi:hypothetical protein
MAFDPTFTPFNFHWYDGAAPPFVGVAVKVTLVPEQILLEDAAIVITGVTCAVTVIAILLDKTEATEAQLALLVSKQLTTSPFTNAALLYVLLFVPTFTPFSFHW